MHRTAPSEVSRVAAAFAELAGAGVWASRMRDLEQGAAGGGRAGKALLQRHALEWTIERLRRRAALAGELGVLIAGLAADTVRLANNLTPAGRGRLREMLSAALNGEGTLVPLFHLIRTASIQRTRGFDVRFAGLDEGAPFDLLLVRGGADAELACDVISAEEGRSVHRSAWFQLADRMDPDLHRWLAAHPGRYLLKVTLPDGLRVEGEGLAVLHERIKRLLAESRRADQDEAVVLRLDPLLLAGAQADDTGLGSALRREFGPEANLSVITRDGGVFVVAARGGREDEVAAAIRRRMAAIAPMRLTGSRPGILAMFVEDTDRLEWRGLRERLELEGAARRFLTHPEAKRVVAVTVASRFELFGAAQPDGAPNGELWFRNPTHPAARSPALAPAVLSSV